MAGMKTKREDDSGCSGSGYSAGVMHPGAGLLIIFIQTDPGLKRNSHETLTYILLSRMKLYLFLFCVCRWGRTAFEDQFDVRKREEEQTSD